MRNDTSFSATETATVDSGMDISFVQVPNPTSPNEQVSIGDNQPPALAVTVTPKYSSIGVDADMKTTVACVNLKARDLPEDDSNDRAPVDIIVALDVSGSMTGSKLELCKKTLSLLLRVLFPEDRFGLICYSTNALIEVPVQKMSAANKKSAMERISKLRAHSATNISAAVGLAYQEMRRIENPNAVQTVFLLTDGHATAGVRDEQGLLQFTKNCFSTFDHGLNQGGEDTTWACGNRIDEGGEESSMMSSVTGATKTHSRSPISLHCFGFGTDHNSHLLEGMSSVLPGGSYYFIENDVDVGSAFGDALGGILSVVAQNVVVTLDVPAEAQSKGVEIVDVYNDHKIKRENGSYTVVVGDFYAEETRDVLFEVKLAADVGGTEVPVVHASVSVSYTDTIKMVPADSERITCELLRPPGSDLSGVNAHVDVQWTRYHTAEAMTNANEMARANNFAGAKERLNAMKSRIQHKKIGKSPALQNMLSSLESDVTTLEEGLRSKSEYQTRGSHTFNNISKTHKAQRRMKGATVGASDMMYSLKSKTTAMEKLSLK